jgi:hypothetical protein
VARLVDGNFNKPVQQLDGARAAAALLVPRRQVAQEDAQERSRIASRREL